MNSTVHCQTFPEHIAAMPQPKRGENTEQTEITEQTEKPIVSSVCSVFSPSFFGWGRGLVMLKLLSTFERNETFLKVCILMLFLTSIPLSH